MTTVGQMQTYNVWAFEQLLFYTTSGNWKVVKTRGPYETYSMVKSGGLPCQEPDDAYMNQWVRATPAPYVVWQIWRWTGEQWVLDQFMRNWGAGGTCFGP